jgi:hypothetical protein
MADVHSGWAGWMIAACERAKGCRKKRLGVWDCLVVAIEECLRQAKRGG